MEGPVHVDVEDVIAEAMNRRFSTIPHLTEAEVGKVWWHVCQLVRRTLITKKKGARISGLGTFTLSRAPHAGETAVFVLSEKFALMHGMRSHAKHVPGGVPVVPLNFAELSMETAHDRATVENCVQEIVAALESHAADPRGISLSFAGLGRFSIRDKKVKFRFYQELVDPTVTLVANGRPRLMSRASTAGSFGSRRSSRPGSRAGRDRLETPRLLASPHVAAVGLGPTTPFEAWAEGNKPSATQSPEKVQWQVDLATGQYIPIFNPGLEGGAGDASRHRSARVPPTVPEDSDSSDDELDEDAAHHVRKLAARNMQSTIFLPLEPLGEQIDHISKVVDFHAPHMAAANATLPAQHKRDAVVTLPRANGVGPQPSRRRSIADREFGLYRTNKSYAARPEGPVSADGAISYVSHQRNRVQHNPAIAETMRKREAAHDVQLRKIAQKQERRAEKIDRLLLAARAEASRRTVDFNRQLAQQRVPTPKDKVTKADVFAFRPATSHTELRRVRKQLSDDLAVQAEHARHARAQQEAQLDHIETVEREIVARMVEDAQAAQAYHKRQTQAKYRAELEGQTQAKVRATLRRPKSGLAQIFRPEMYTTEEEHERIRLANERETYEVQIEAEAARKRQLLKTREAETRLSERIVAKSNQAFVEDMRRQGQLALEKKKSMAQEWMSAAARKQLRDAEEVEHRKAGADMVLLEQTFDYDHFGRYGRGFDSTGTSFVGAAQLVKASQELH